MAHYVTEAKMEIKHVNAKRDRNGRPLNILQPLPTKIYKLRCEFSLLVASGISGASAVSRMMTYDIPSNDLDPATDSSLFPASSLMVVLLYFWFE
jgi:hypothetical protein